MICLPAVAQLEGTPLLVPPTTNSSKLLHDLMATLGSGTCIECENEDIMESMMVSTCMMGPIYGLMRANRDFLISKGVPRKDASRMVGRQYWGMVKDAVIKCEDEDSLDALIDEQTPGGLNEQSLKNLESVGFLKSYEDAMESVLGRIKGETDGSMKTS
jgi:pyrroline-5-carboxylate reductase